MIEDIFASFPALVAYIPIATGYLLRLIPLDGWKARGVSWLVAAVLVAIGCIADLGFLANMTPKECLIQAVLAGGIANGLFTWDWVKGFLHFIKADQPAVLRHAEILRAQ